MPFQKQLVAAVFILALLLTAHPGAEATAATGGQCESPMQWSICKANWMCTALCCVAMQGYTGGYCSSNTAMNQAAPAWLGFGSCFCTKACHGAPPPKPWVQPPPTTGLQPPPMPPTPWVQPPLIPMPWVKPPPMPTPCFRPPPMPTPWVKPPPMPTPCFKPLPTPMPCIRPPPMPMPWVKPPPMPTPWVQPLPTPGVQPLPMPTPWVQPWPIPTPWVKPTAEKQPVNHRRLGAQLMM